MGSGVHTCNWLIWLSWLSWLSWDSWLSMATCWGPKPRFSAPFPPGYFNRDGGTWSKRRNSCDCFSQPSSLPNKTAAGRGDWCECGRGGRCYLRGKDGRRHLAAEVALRGKLRTASARGHATAEHGALEGGGGGPQASSASTVTHTLLPVKPSGCTTQTDGEFAPGALSVTMTIL